MSGADLSSLAPELVLTAGGVLILLLDAFLPALRRSFTALGLLVTLLAARAAWSWVPTGASFDGLLEANLFTRALSLVVLLATFLGLLACQGYLRRERILAGEYHALLLWCAAGLLLMLRATELLIVFLALETLSLCLYPLAAFHRRLQIGTEGAIKYFLMGAFVSAFILYGIALLYGTTQSTRFQDIAPAFRDGGTPLASLGVLLLVAGFGFKMSLVPFHAWSPDTYQGAPSPFVAFLSVAPKAAAAMVLFRVLEMVSGGVAGADWSKVVAVLAVLSMVAGNLLALVQRDIKRMLAYSGIAHMGYLLLALVVLDRGSLTPVIVYLLAYVLMNAGAFTVVALLYSRPGEQHPISELSGWGYRYPLLSACLAVCMLSLGGLPPTVGFFGKYLVFLNAVGDGLVGLAVVGVLASLVGVFYYLRVVYVLYMKAEARAPQGLLIDGWGRAAALIAAAATLLFGIWPTRLLEWLLHVMPLR